jgi:hypothetical protein
MSKLNIKDLLFVAMDPSGNKRANNGPRVCNLLMAGVRLWDSQAMSENAKST